MVINNAGTLQNLERLPVIQSIYAYGVSKNNSGMMSKIKLGHVVGSTSAIGGCQLNEGTIKQISLGNIESEDYSCGLVSFNKGSIKKVAINKVSSGQRAYGLMWRNYGGQAEHVFINQVISQKVAYGIGQLNKKGIIRNIQINKIESEKIYGIVESNAENSHLEHILINTIQRLPQSEAEIYGWVVKNERSLLHHIYLNSFPATIKCPESLLTDEQVNCLFVSTKTDYMNHDKFIYVNSLDVEKVKNLLLKNHWNMQTNGSPLFVWYWSETGLALKKISINNRYQDAIKLLAIFRTLANPSNNPDGTTEIQSMPIDILASIADYLTVSSFSNLQRSNIIHYAFNKKTINHFNEFEQLLSPTLAPR